MTSNSRYGPSGTAQQLFDKKLREARLKRDANASAAPSRPPSSNSTGGGLSAGQPEPGPSKPRASGSSASPGVSAHPGPAQPETRSKRARTSATRMGQVIKTNMDPSSSVPDRLSSDGKGNAAETNREVVTGHMRRMLKELCNGGREVSESVERRPLFNLMPGYCSVRLLYLHDRDASAVA